MSVMRCESCERTIDTDYNLGIYISAPKLRGYEFFFCSPECADRWLEENRFNTLPEDFDNVDIHIAKTQRRNQ